jgi:hypothetical protein
MIVENLQQLYTEVFKDWILANEEAAEELRWRAFAIEQFRSVQMRGSQLNFVDAFVHFVIGRSRSRRRLLNLLMLWTKRMSPSLRRVLPRLI